MKHYQKRILGLVLLPSILVNTFLPSLVRPARAVQRCIVDEATLSLTVHELPSDQSRILSRLPAKTPVFHPTWSPTYEVSQEDQFALYDGEIWITVEFRDTDNKFIVGWAKAANIFCDVEGDMSDLYQSPIEGFPFTIQKCSSDEIFVASPLYGKGNKNFCQGRNSDSESDSDSQGIIRGTIGYPSEENPPGLVCAQAVNNPQDLTCLHVSGGPPGTTYELYVKPGNYYIFYYTWGADLSTGLTLYYNNEQYPIPAIEISIQEDEIVEGIHLSAWGLCEREPSERTIEYRWFNPYCLKGDFIYHNHRKSRKRISQKTPNIEETISQEQNKNSDDVKEAIPINRDFDEGLKKINRENMKADVLYIKGGIHSGNQENNSPNNINFGMGVLDIYSDIVDAKIWNSNFNFGHWNNRKGQDVYGIEAFAVNHKVNLNFKIGKYSLAGFEAEGLNAKWGAKFIPDGGIEVGSRVTLFALGNTWGTSNSESKIDKQTRLAFGRGGLGGRLHWADIDGDNFREYGFGLDGLVTFDIKTEDPLRTILDLGPLAGYVLYKWKPNENLTHEAIENLSAIGSDIADLFDDVSSRIEGLFD